MKLTHLFEDQTNNVAIPVFRGVTKKVLDGPVQFSVRNNRRPAEASIWFSTLFNIGIQRKFGIVDIRKNSVFSSTDIDVASQYAGGEDGSILQLQVPASAVIVYNPSVPDSLFLEDDASGFLEVLDNLADEWTAATGNEQQDFENEFNFEDTGSYLSMDSLSFYRNLLQQAVGERAGAYMQEIEEIADGIVDGYVKAAPQQFAQQQLGDNVEVIITNLTSYLGVAVENETPSDY